MNTTQDISVDETLKKLEELRQKANAELSPSQRLLFLELMEKEMDQLNEKLDKMLAETSA